MDLTLNLSAVPSEPFAIAFSGGGDSTALLHALREFSPLALIVDHGLRAGSAEEARKAKYFAVSLGLKAQILTWRAPPLKTGIQAKARLARYDLLGQACRRRSLKYLLTGHTEDDQAETVLMRLKAGGSWRGAAGMRPLTVSPVWPQLASVTLCRPMLSASRSHIRAYLKHHDLPYADDPSNENRHFARIRARDALQRAPLLRREMLELSRDMSLGRARERQLFAEQVRRTVSGDIFGNLSLTSVPPPYLLGHILRAVGGTGARARGGELRRLTAAMTSPDFRGASLGGAVVSQYKQGWIVMRDPVMAFGRSDVTPLAEQPISGRTLWDGRFWMDGEGTLAPASKTWAQAPKPLAAALRACPAPARAALPVWRANGKLLAIGPIGRDGQRLASVRSAILPRLQHEVEAASIEPK